MDMTAGPLLICIRCILYSIVHLPTSVTFLPHPAAEVLCEKSLVSETVRWS